MKKLLIIPLLLFCISAFGQWTKPQLYENINTNIRLKSFSATRLSAVLDSIVVSMGSGGGSMVYPGAGIPLSTGSAWGTSITDNSADWNDALRIGATQTNTTAKTFNNATLLMRNVADTYSSYFTNTNTAARTYTLPDFTGSAMTSGGTQALAGHTYFTGSYELSLGTYSSPISAQYNVASSYIQNVVKGSTSDNTILLNTSTFRVTLSEPGSTFRFIGASAPSVGDIWTASNVDGTGYWAAPSGGGSGTVTSVAASVPSFLSISGSPITTSGTLAISLSGTALPVANGGTGITSLGTGVATALGANVSGSGGIAMTNSPTFTGTPIFPSTFTVGANSFVRSGAHGLTLTTTGTTNVTLPTTGTLATLGANTFTGAQSVFGGTWNMLYTGNLDMANSNVAYIRNYNTGTSATSGIKIANTANTGGLLITETGSAYTATGTYGSVGANVAVIWNTENAPMVFGTNNNKVITLGTSGEVTYATIPTTDNTAYRVLAVNSSGVTKVIDNIVPVVSYSGTANSTTYNILDFTNFPNSSMVTIELQISFKQTSGTPSASAIYYKISRTFRRDSGGTVAAVAATTTLVSVNDTGDTFTVAPTIDVGGSSLNLVYNLSTAKTFSVEARQITTKL